MSIDFECEITELASGIKKADGFLDCEKVIVRNIRKHIEKGVDEKTISDFLNRSGDYFQNKISSTQQLADCTNYRYAEAFINTLVKMPYWKSWIKTINI